MRKPKGSRSGLLFALGLIAVVVLARMVISTETTLGAVVVGAILLAAGVAAIVQGLRQRN